MTAQISLQRTRPQQRAFTAPAFGEGDYVKMTGAAIAKRRPLLTLLWLAALVSCVSATDDASHPASDGAAPTHHAVDGAAPTHPAVDDAAPTHPAVDHAAPHAVEDAAPHHGGRVAPHRAHHHARAQTTVTLTHWYGRLGNNIHQIRHAAKVAFCCQGVLQLPDSHYVLNMTRSTFDLGFGPAGRDCPRNISGEFFFVNHVRGGAHKVYHECQADVDDIWSEITGSLFPRSAHLCATYGTPDCCPPDMDDVLVAHIRSGDLFSSKEPSKFYFPAPLVYYTSVMTERNWSRVVLVTEDELNPVTTVLGRVMKGALSSPVEVFSQRLEDDVHMLRCAVHVAIARSTFSERLAALAPNLRTVYSPYAKACPKKNVAGIFYTFPNFNDTHWANTPDQINDMVRQSDVVREAYEC